MLPTKVLKALTQRLEAALAEDDNNNHLDDVQRSPQCIQKFRQAFFDIIIELFLNYQKRVKLVDGETVFDYKGFLDESDPDYVEFFHNYLQIDSKGTQSNNQMFNNFITITAGRRVNQDIPEDDLLMAEHVRGAIKKVQNAFET